MKIELNACYRVSPDVIAREIEGELVIVPLKAGLGDLDAEMYALSTTGIAIWNKLNGGTPLDDVIKALSAEYGAAYEEVRTDVVELMEELLDKGLAIGP